MTGIESAQAPRAPSDHVRKPQADADIGSVADR
jgi:hypothetical protein